MKKELNFEINILPILDILSVLICFLLLTAVWVQIGTLDTRQALGDNSSNGAVNPPSLWIGVATNGTLKISLRDVKSVATPQDSVLSARGAGIDWQAFSQKIDSLHAQIPELKTVVISPEAKANYGDVIRLMDQLKQKQLTDIGLSPLG
jgi:biopolymer transport protein TolR